MKVDPALLGRYLPADLVEKLLGQGDLSLEDNLKTVGYLSDLLSAISMYVPEHISRQVTLLDVGEDYLAPSLIEGTFLFADISGFTPLTEAMAAKGRVGAEELTIVINSLFEQLLEVVAGYDGSVLKFGGDAILALFAASPGGPAGSHARRALNVAHAMQRVVKRFRKLPSGVKGVTLSISIGMASGRVFASQVGDPAQRTEYVVAGETLRRMARTEAAAESGEVFADRETIELYGEPLTLGRGTEEYACVEALPKVSEDSIRSVRVRAEPHLSASGSLDLKLSRLVDGIETLRVFLPRPLFERIKASPDRIDIEPEHRQVTTTFINFQGLDEVVALAGDELSIVQEPLSTFFQEVEQQVHRHGGIISRIGPATQGDNFLILFGAPTSSGDDARNAALCALGIRDSVARLREAGRIPFKIKIGVNTGFSFCADVGSTLRKEYTVMGDPVNLAARLMSIADEGTIRIGDSTAALLDKSFATKAMDPVHVKGKSMPVQTHLLTGHSRRSQMRMVTTTFQRRRGQLGRQEELKILREQCQKASDGQGQVVVVLGEMGVGKSLFLESSQKLCDRIGFNCLRIETGELEVSSPNRPWVLLLLKLLEVGVAEDMDAAVFIGDLRQVLGERFPEFMPWDALIASYLDITVPETENLYANLTARGKNDQFRNILTSVLEVASREQPLGLFLDNVEKIDQASLSILHHLIDRIETLPIFLSLTSSDGKFFEMFFQLPHVTRLELGGLDPDAIKRLIEEQVEVPGIPETLVQGILERTQGNPLLVTEMVAGLIRQGHLVIDVERGAVRLARRLDEVGVADQLHTYFITKLDRVDYNCRRALNLATVLSEPFEAADVVDLHERLEKGDHDFLDLLQQGVREGILVEGSTRRETRTVQVDGVEIVRRTVSVQVPTYTFQHPMLRDVLYENIAFETRRQMHREQGKILEKEMFPNFERGVDRLAHHFERSDDHDRAIEYLIMAGDRAKEKFANAEASEYYAKAVERIEEHRIHRSRLVPVLDRLARVLELEGRTSESIDRLQECRRHALEQSATSASKIGRLMTKQGDLVAADKALDEAQRTFEEIGDAYGLGHCLHNLGQLVLAQGSAAEAIRVLTRSFESLKEVADQEGIARCLHTLSLAYKASGDYLRAADYLKSSLGINDKLQNVFGKGICLKTLGEIFLELERFESAEENLAEARKSLEQVGDKYSLAANHESQGLLLLYRARLEEAAACFTRGARLWEEMGELVSAVRCRLARGNVRRLRGDLENAWDDLAALDGIQNPVCVTRASILEGDLHHDEGRLEEARRCHKQGLVMAQDRGLAEEECHAYLALGADLLVGSRLNQAMGAVTLAFQKARQVQRRRLIILAGKGLGDLYRRTGREDRALEFYTAAMEQAQQSGYLDLLPQILASMAEVMAGASGDLATALDVGKEAYGLAKKLGSPVARIEALSAIVSTVLVAGRVRKYTSQLDRLLREAEDLGAPLLRSRSHLLAARVFQSLGENERAGRHARVSLELSQSLGCLWLIVPAYRVLVETNPGDERVRATWQQAAERMAEVIMDVASASD